ncbi:hypothetical protein [Bradyrhizobium erythrophlei]|jgi:hypothetical protein|uniref:Uncharacterized protein n=1 Tax=Bradyrhizobium erythrophlei TaxID=1437360 RepID=A0A1M5JXQ3_9BRAD|nr:hypothetical protein [Bradyrhizobium erythrophlei]SHG45377.1 hypothetical protein SAMN05444169_2547 [Bradyrhizobium erythrophlei]
MLNPAPRGNDQQIAVTAAESAALIVVPEKIEFLNFLADKTESIDLPDVQGRLDGEGRYPRQVSEQVQAEEDQPKELKRETSFLGGALRFAGAIVGYMLGGPAGAALGSIVGEVMGDMAAERSSIIWPDLGRAFFYPKVGYQEEDACDRGSHDSIHLERSRCEGRRTTDL